MIETVGALAFSVGIATFGDASPRDGPTMNADVSRLHDHHLPNEDASYRTARNELLLAELDLRRMTERVAALRRALPPGGLVPEDYVFEAGEDARPVRLSELFGEKQTLIIYCYMYGPAMAQPCPACTSILDGLDGQVPHLTRTVALAVVARAPIAALLAVRAERGWRNLPLVSSAHNTFQRDYFGEEPDGSQESWLHVFTRRGGQVRHAWASELNWAPEDPGQETRHADTIWPLWNLLDLTPDGRGSFRPKLNY